MKRMRLCYDMLSLISKPGFKGPKDPKANTPLLPVCIADLCWSLRRSRVSNTTPRAALPSWALPLPGAPRSGWSWWPQPRTELAPGGFPTVVPHNEDGNTTRLLTFNTFQICLQGPRCSKCEHDSALFHPPQENNGTNPWLGVVYCLGRIC